MTTKSTAVVMTNRHEGFVKVLVVFSRLRTHHVSVLPCFLGEVGCARMCRGYRCKFFNVLFVALNVVIC